MTKNGIPILPRPDLPAGVSKAIDDNKLVVFVGAGVSRLMGCASWEDLGNRLIEKCYESQYINFAERCALKENADYKKIITICHKILRGEDSIDKFKEVFHEALKPDRDERAKFQDIYDVLYGLHGLFLTTNVDGLFGEVFGDEQVIYDCLKLDPRGFLQDLKRDKLYCIHGDFERNMDSTVFTVEQYIRQYNNKIFRKFLSVVFSENTVLFIGYGMSEFEVLDYLMSRSGAEDGKPLHQHYLLEGYFTHGENFVRMDTRYYETLGIQVVPFALDKHGYDQLYTILKDWSEEINSVTTYQHDVRSEIQSLVDSSRETDILRALQLISNNSSLERDLFRALSEHDNPLPWLPPLDKKGYLSAEKNPTPYEDPESPGSLFTDNWPVLWYLKNLAKVNFHNPRDRVTASLLKFINDVVSYEKNGERIQNWMTDNTIFDLICLLPKGEINLGHIENIRELLASDFDSIGISADIGESLLPRLIEEENTKLLLELLDVVLSFKETRGGSRREFESVLGNHWLIDALSKNKSRIAEICAEEAGKLGIQKITQLLEIDNSTFSYIWIPAIEENEQNHFPDRYESQLVQFVRDMLVVVVASRLEGIVRELLGAKHSILRRIGTHLISKRFTELRSLFWESSENPLDDTELHHEIHSLLDSNCEKFSDEQLAKVLAWIDSQKYLRKLRKEGDNEWHAYYSKGWLMPLLKTNNTNVLRIYHQYDQINPAPVEHADFLSWSSGVVTVGREDDSYDFESKKPDALAAGMGTPMPCDDPRKSKCYMVPPVAFGDYVKTHPEAYDKALDHFIEVPTEYKQRLISGFTEAWRAGTHFSVGHVIDYIQTIIGDEGFGAEKFDKYHNYRDWLISDIGEFISVGTIRDDNAFHEEHLDRMEAILLLLMDSAPSAVTDEDKASRICNAVLNSPKGKIYHAAVRLSLRHARVHKSTETQRWRPAIKDRFTRELCGDREHNPDFSETLGEFLPFFSYLDNDWVRDNIGHIFPDGENVWRLTISAYLFASRNVYEVIYRLLRENGVYTRAIDSDFDDAHISTKLAQEICIGYLAGWDELEDAKGLIHNVLSKANPEHLGAIVRFISGRKDVEEKGYEDKIKALWWDIVPRIKKIGDTGQSQEMLSGLGSWLLLISELDVDSVKACMESARYLRKGHKDFEFIKGLLKHVEKHPAYVGKLFVEAVNNDNCPGYDQKNIIEIVDTLFGKEEVEAARRICNQYLETGYMFLKSTFDKYTEKEGEKL